MSACNSYFCCAPETCSNLGTKSISLSSHHMVCELHENLLESSSFDCGHCKSLVRIEHQSSDSNYKGYYCIDCQLNLIEEMNSTRCSSCSKFYLRYGSSTGNCSSQYCSKNSEIYCECSPTSIFCRDHFSSHFQLCWSSFTLPDNKVQNSESSKESIKNKRLLILIEIFLENFEKYQSNLLTSLIKNKEFKINLLKHKIFESETILMSLWRDFDKNLIISIDKSEWIELFILFKTYKTSKKVVLHVIISIFDKFIDKIIKIQLIVYNVLSEKKNSLDDDCFQKIVQGLKKFYNTFIENFEIFQGLSEFNLYESVPGKNQENRFTLSESDEEYRSVNFIKPKKFHSMGSVDLNSRYSSLGIQEENYINLNVSKADSLQELDEENSVKIDTNYISFTEGDEVATCLMCNQAGLVEYFSCGHKACSDCLLNKKCTICVPKSLNCAKCKTISEPLCPCNHCSQLYCKNCMVFHELLIKNPNLCLICYKSDETVKFECNHRFCINCFDSNEEACPICYSTESQCNVCARKGHRKKKFNKCEHNGCEFCKIYEFCFVCISSMEKKLLKKHLNLEKVKKKCIVCDKTNKFSVLMMCKDYVCLDCLYDLENCDYFCLKCFEKLEVKVCVRCKMEYHVTLVEGIQVKSCCAFVIQKKNSLVSKIINFFR